MYVNFNLYDKIFIDTAEMMTDLIIDAEFKDLIPSLTDDEYKQLKENILRDGIQDALKTWNGILIDGHNRYEIDTRYDLPFQTTAIKFASRDDVIEWIIKNQFGRRNLSAYDRSLLALRLKPIIAAKAKKNQIRKPAESVLQKSVKQKPINTQKEIATAVGVSHDTIAKVEKIEQSATPEIKAALNTAYKEVKKAERKEELQRQVEEIEQKVIEEPDGLFDVIVIDPPCSYGDGHLYHVDGWRVSAPYPEMTQDELKQIELPAADNCVLCLWTTNQFIWNAKSLMDNWGFKYRFIFVWNKQKMGVGRRIRM